MAGIGGLPDGFVIIVDERQSQDYPEQLEENKQELARDYDPSYKLRRFKFSYEGGRRIRIDRKERGVMMKILQIEIGASSASAIIAFALPCPAL